MEVRFYGRLADMLGRELRIAVPDAGCSVAELRASIAGAHPQAADDLLGPRVRACVGDSIVDDDHRLSTSEKVEFFPPVSGG